MYNILVTSMEWNRTKTYYTNNILLNGNKMETIYIHTHFLDTKMLPYFFFLGGFSNIDFYCVKHNTPTGTYFASLYCRRLGGGATL